MQWKFGPGDEVHYNETQKATITSEGKTTEREYAVTLQYYVKKVSKEGTAQVIVSGKNLDTKGTDSELTRFLFHSSPNLGSFSMSPSGRMRNVSGLISIRSLPTLSQRFVKDRLKTVNTWLDLIYPVATSCYSRPANMIFLRDNVRKELFLK